MMRLQECSMIKIESTTSNNQLFYISHTQTNVTNTTIISRLSFFTLLGINNIQLRFIYFCFIAKLFMQIDRKCSSMDVKCYYIIQYSVCRCYFQVVAVIFLYICNICFISFKWYFANNNFHLKFDTKTIRIPLFSYPAYGGDTFLYHFTLLRADWTDFKTNILSYYNYNL